MDCSFSIYIDHHLMATRLAPHSGVFASAGHAHPAINVIIFPESPHSSEDFMLITRTVGHTERSAAELPLCLENQHSAPTSLQLSAAYRAAVRSVIGRNPKVRPTFSRTVCGMLAATAHEVVRLPEVGRPRCRLRAVPACAHGTSFDILFQGSGQGDDPSEWNPADTLKHLILMSGWWTH